MLDLIESKMADPHALAVLLGAIGSAATVVALAAARYACAPHQGRQHGARAHSRPGARTAARRGDQVDVAREAQRSRQATGRNAQSFELAQHRDRQEATGDGGLSRGRRRIRFSHLPVAGTDQLPSDRGRLRLSDSSLESAHYYQTRGRDLTNPLILKDSKTPEFLILAHDDVANRAGRRGCASRSIGWNWFMIF